MFDYQNDDRWKNDVMTEKKGIWKDTLGRWGCNVAALSNVINVLHSANISTPGSLNGAIKNLLAYKFLADPTCKEEEASFLIERMLCQHFGFIVEYDCLYNSDSYVYVATIVHPVTGGTHFINVLRKWKDCYLCYDVEDGKIKLLRVSEIVRFKRYRSL
jgi:hypothetical protein